MKLKLLLPLALLLVTNALFAQLKTWTWDTYKMKFKAPSSFTVDENTSKIFDAGNGKLHLTIYPQKGDKMAKDEMTSALRSWARENNVKYSGGVQTMHDLNGYWGVYVDGKAENGNPTSVLLLVDPDFPTIQLYVWLQYQSDYLDTAVEILKSFQPS